MKETKIAFGIVGYGRIAEILHRPLLESMGEARLVAAYDVTEARREAARKAGMETYSSFEKFLRDDRIHAVAITTPTNMHHEHTVRVLRAKKHVVVDKPAALNAAEFRDMIAESKRNRRLLTVFHNRRFDGDFIAVKKFLETGRLGKIFSIQMRIQHWGSMWGFGVEEYHQNWRNERRFGGGGLYDWGSHIVDQLVLMKPGRIEKIAAILQPGITAKDCDDLFIGLVRFGDGSDAVLEVNYVTKYPLPRWTVLGERGTLTSEPHNSNDIKVFFHKENIERHLAPTPGDCKIIYTSFINKIREPGELAVTPASVLKTMELLDAFRTAANGGEKRHA